MALNLLNDAERVDAERRAAMLLASSLRAIEILQDYNSHHPERAMRVDPLELRADLARDVLSQLLSGKPEVDLWPLHLAEMCWPDYSRGNVRLPQPAVWCKKQLDREAAAKRSEGED